MTYYVFRVEEYDLFAFLMWTANAFVIPSPSSSIFW
jgi:hypothetical protein